jgi:hypothetical protein
LAAHRLHHVSIETLQAVDVARAHRANDLSRKPASGQADELRHPVEVFAIAKRQADGERRSGHFLIAYTLEYTVNLGML